MKWEYKTVCLSIRGLMAPKVDVEEIDSAFDRLGREGWDLVSALDTNMGYGASFELVAIFKRQGSPA